MDEEENSILRLWNEGRSYKKKKKKVEMWVERRQQQQQRWRRCKDMRTTKRGEEPLKNQDIKIIITIIISLTSTSLLSRFLTKLLLSHSLFLLPYWWSSSQIQNLMLCEDEEIYIFFFIQLLQRTRQTDDSQAVFFLCFLFLDFIGMFF